MKEQVVTDNKESQMKKQKKENRLTKVYIR